MILPMWPLDSMSRCAAATLASAKTSWITGFTTPLPRSGQTFSQRRGDGGLLRVGPRPEGGAGDRLALEHHPHEVDFHLAAFEEGDESEASFGGQELF